MSAGQPSIMAVSAGLSSPSSTRLLTDRLVDATTASISRRGEALSVEIVELRTLATDIAANLVTGFASEQLGQVLDRVGSADGLIAVSPTFAGSYSGLFKSFFDLVDPAALTDTPVLLGATAGTARHSLMLDHAMRPLFTYLHANVMPVGVFAATDDFASDGLADRVTRAGEQFALAMLGTSSVTGFAPSAREVPQAPQDLGPVPDFRTLLLGHDGHPHP